MLRPSRSPAFGLLLLLGVFVGPLCTPARSAPPVVRDLRAARSDPYPDAAAALGFREWGDTKSNEQVTHVTARFDSERIRLTIALPPKTPINAAETWLRSLSDAMGWQNVELRSSPQPECLLLRADVRNTVRSRRFGTSEAALDPAVLARELHKLTSNPAVLGIRVVGSGLESVTLPPATSGPSDGDHFLFYRLSGINPASGPLKLVYGIPRRWLAAGAMGLLLWLLFPVVALFAVRSYLAGQTELEAKQRLALYRRWQRGVLVVPVVVAVGGLILSRFSFLTYFGTAFAVATPLMIVLPSTLFALVARLIGMPLERAAWPQRAELPWYRVASVELGISAVIVTMVAATSVSMPALMRAGGGSAPPHVFVLPMLVPLLFVLAAGAWSAYNSHRRKKGCLPNETDAPEELATPVRELTTRLGCPVERVRVVTERGGLMAGTVQLLGNLAVIGREITERMEPDQVAALVAATALAQPRTRKDRWLNGLLTTGVLLPAVLILGTLFFNPGGFARNRTVLPFMVLLGPFTMMGSMVTQRRNQKRQENADLLAAEALCKPGRFLLALRQLEELQIAAGGLDPTAARSAVIFQRRTRLERRLGLE